LVLALAACGGPEGSSTDASVDVATPDAPPRQFVSWSFEASKNPSLTKDVSATIAGTAITVTLPVGGTREALVPTFEIAGYGAFIESVAQTSGVDAHDFSQPVTYDVKDIDGLYTTYTVTVQTTEFAPRVRFTGASEVQSIVLTDMNADGKLDVVTGYWQAIAVSLNTTATGSTTASFGALASFAAANSSWVSNIDVTDLNADAKPDVLYTAISPRTRLSTTTTSATTATLSSEVEVTMTHTAYGAAHADINGDGRPDFIGVVPYDHAVFVQLNTTASNAAAASFTTPSLIDLGTEGFFVTAGDLDLDGKPDLVTTNTNTGNGSVLINTTATNASAPTFAAHVDLSPLTSGHGVAIADLNGDAKPDLIFANNGHPSVSIFLNTTTTVGTLTFAQRIDVPSLACARGVAVGDVNADGRPDIVTANPCPSKVGVLFQTSTSVGGTVTFTPPVGVEVGPDPVSVAVGDLNGDGKLDIVSGDADTGAEGGFSVVLAP
jgi:hypothetical protein